MSAVLRRRLARAVGRDLIRRGNLVLPPRDIRFDDPGLDDDSIYLASARSEAQVLVDWFGLDSSTRLLEVGSGQGRVAIGILDVLGGMRCYHGVDVASPSVDWCRRHIQARHPTFHFTHLDVMNPRGHPLDDTFRFPFEDDAFDLISLSGVVPFLFPDELDVYLDEFERILAPNGRVHLTAFVDHDALAIEIEPDGDQGGCWNGPRPCVRYETGFFVFLLAEHGFAVERVEHGVALRGESRLGLCRTEDIGQVDGFAGAR